MTKRVRYIASDAQRIVAPVLSIIRRMIEIQFRGIGEVLRTKFDLSLISRRNSDERKVVNRCRHDESFVVIGVFANQVHPARRVKDARLNTEHFCEGLC